MSSNPNNPRDTANKCPICDWCDSVGFNKHLNDKIEDGDIKHRDLKESIITLYDELDGPHAVASRLEIDKRFVKFVAKSEGLTHKKETINHCPICSWEGAINFNKHLYGMSDAKHIQLLDLIVSMGDRGSYPIDIAQITEISKKLVISILEDNDARKWVEHHRKVANDG